ncbi:MAG: RNA polymerase-associated protein RapA [Gammaproteobacteria bacterium]|nr:MAG: RNA polymerase-associated protein RapA [Gammaproteobacteria bacterium]
MGLGIVVEVDQRRITITFNATGETRVYAVETAPLSRVEFVPGDQVKSNEGWILNIESVTDDNGILTYHGHRDGDYAELPEAELDNFIQLNRPGDRLLSGQIDNDKWFDLRYETRLHSNRLCHSNVYGLGGGRTSLIPHQLYITHEVASRYAPRVLLADEVGLGKTIEAGLILHQQLLAERARRVLIVVPENLLHQWLVEMLRRFNLHFSIFNEERCQAADQSTEQDNPFHSEQLVLCSLEFLMAHPSRQQQTLQGDWDLLVVDEAHHLQWSPDEVSPEYRLIEDLANVTSGVLLLTATPEQLGKASHFARLRLLDPGRFPDFDAFVEEENSYEPVAIAVAALLDDQPLNKQVIQTLRSGLQHGVNEEILAQIDDRDISESTRTQLIEQLLDRHGTGRVLFRNTRDAVKGFPDRELHKYPMPCPDEYHQTLREFQTTAISEPQLLLCPELLFEAVATLEQGCWSDIDPRVNWLSGKLKELKPDKVLVITASADTALDLAQALKARTGLHAAVFHEGLSIIERDRAAAFFADPVGGGQVLICSEIGSEGRNFQFSHHLVLFDLPINPDLLEQRIGRLDRIGQKETIQIHVPYLQGTAQEIMFHWYHEGLSAFEHTCPTGHNVFVKVKDTLLNALHQADEGIADLNALLTTSRNLYRDLTEDLHRGRDRLLEYNSCRPEVARRIIASINDEENESSILEYLNKVFDNFGIDIEIHRSHSYVIHPGNHMQTGTFPGLPADGMTITCNRDTALSNEDLHYITWEHPLVTGAMDMVLSGELGNTAINAIKLRGIEQGTLLLECLYILESPSSELLQSGRYLPPTNIRIVIDSSSRDLSDKLSHDVVSSHRQPVDNETACRIINAYSQELRNMLNAAEKMATSKTPGLLNDAHRQTKQSLMKEITRLKELQHVNPNVRNEEINFYENNLTALGKALDHSGLRLDALRVIVTL